MDKLTIYDISKLSEVSITTVSRVLNGSPNVNKETKARVEAVISKYGYVPMQKSRNFHRKELFTVGLMMDDIRHQYMSELAYAINQELEQWKANTILCNIADVEREFIGKVDNLVERRVNGIILLGSIFENEICKATIERRYSGIPFVAVNANFALPNVCEVMQNQMQGCKDAVTYLVEEGHRKIGWIFYHKSKSDHQKHLGFLNGIQAYKLERYMLEADEPTLAAGKKATELLLERYPNLDAIVYSSDFLAVGGIHFFHERGIRVPEEIAIVGYNNSSCAYHCCPPLTSVDNQTDASGKAAAQIMVNILNQQPVENVLVPCKLEIRRSSNSNL